jgi:hypothetical protein
MEKTMNKNSSISRDLTVLKKRVARLKRLPMRKLNDAICDIIDLKGYGLAVLLRKLPEFSQERQLKIAQKVEDFLYFHPENGVKVFDRIKRAYESSCEECRPHLLSAMVDVSQRMRDGELQKSNLLKEAKEVLESSTDLTRKGKALEIIGESENRELILVVIKNIIKAVEKVGEFSGYHFIENSLLSLKRLGGDSLLRLLINPMSDETIKKLRIEWRSEKPEIVDMVLRQTHSLDSDFAQTLLKVVDLSDFNLPFVAMIQEGVSHSDKWVRQAAVASMEKASQGLSPELLSRMLNDSSPEVRLMAAASLGGFSSEQTGDLLEALAEKGGETIGTRMNALYALHSQKNLAALERISASSEPRIALNAIGLAALLKPRNESLESLLKVYSGLKPDRALELQYYLLELAEPEDLKGLIDYHKAAANDVQKDNCIELLKRFLLQKAGPRLERAKSLLTDGERKAIDILTSGGLSENG